MTHLAPIAWQDNCLVLLDQTLLPGETVFLRLTAPEQVWEAIKMLRVRGAPAIGISAAFAFYLGLRAKCDASTDNFRAEAQRLSDYLNSSRPTAVNLRWALERMMAVLLSCGEQPRSEALTRLLAEALALLEEDQEICKAIGRHGAQLLADNSTVITHCNAGGLATTGWGTALAPLYIAKGLGRKVAVFADETRPLLQGARLTAFELHAAGIPVTVICDSMAATVMRRQKIDLVVVGADRVVANGDFANKIGTYPLALAAREHGVPFYCAVPLSTIDLRLATGDAIPIEERDPDEIAFSSGKRVVPEGVPIFNPAFDVTPHTLVAGFITERGIVRPPFEKTLPALFTEAI